MEGVYQHYIIDLLSNNNFVQIPTVQGDGNNIRGFEVELIQNGVPYVIDKDNIICIMGTKPDTKQIMNTCKLTDNGYILVDITSQMSAVKGRGDYSIVLMDKNTNSQIKSFPFYIITTPAPFNISEIVSSDEFQLLTQTISKAEADYTYVMESAQSSADAAKASEKKAKISETNAANSASNASASETNAQSAKEEAAVSANSAATNATSASDSANIAGTKAANAANSAANAAASATNAADSANLSESWAIGGTGTRTDENTNNSRYYSTQASHSASNAAASATNASTSASNAATSATDASTSASNAAMSASIANTKAIEAGDSSEAAALAERKVENNVTIVTEKANNAADSALSANQKATEASNFARKAESFAHGETGTRDNENVDNSKYYYEQAKRISEGLQGSLLPMGTITFSQLTEQSPLAGYMYNISDDFVTDSTFKEGIGYTYPAGTNVYWTADGYWDALAGTMVTGVKGAAESSYRKGNINITPEDIGALATDAVDFSRNLSSGTKIGTLTINGTSTDLYCQTNTDTNTTYSAGTGISLSGTTFSNSGVRSISTGSANGTISVNTNGKSTNIAVKGLGSAAYTASSAYAAASHTHNYIPTSASCNKNWFWDGSHGTQPTWLWGSNDGQNMYVYNPSNFSVNYANSAGSVAWNNVSGKPNTFAPASHTHDDRYYTEAEVNTKLQSIPKISIYKVKVTSASGTINIPSQRGVLSVQNCGASISNDMVTSWQVMSDTTLYYNKNGQSETQIEIVYISP